jgi:protein TonB
MSKSKALFFFIFLYSAGLQAQETEKNTKFVGGVVETDPVYNGGLEEFYNYVYTNIPKSSEMKGRFFVSFFIEEDGSVTEVKILKGISGSIDQKMLAALQKMPKWTPARLRDTVIRKKQVMQIGY